MKKKFIEPELIRIDLRMAESIAASEQYQEYQNGFLGVIVKQYGDACYELYKDTNYPVVENPLITEKFLLDLLNSQCFKNSAAKAMAFSAYGLR